MREKNGGVGMNCASTRARRIEWINCLLQKRSPQPANRLRPRRSRGTPHTLRYCGSVTCKSSSVVFRLSLSLSHSLTHSLSHALSISLSLSLRHQRPKNSREADKSAQRQLFPRCCRRSKIATICNEEVIIHRSRR